MDKQVPVYIYSLQTGVVSWRVLNSAKEEISNPVMIDFNDTNYGVMVPYGGYLQVTLDATHNMNIISNGTASYVLITAQPSKTTTFKVVSTLVCRVNALSD